MSLLSSFSRFPTDLQSFIDYIWAQFQARSGKATDYNGWHTWYPVFSFNMMDPFGKSVKDSFDLGKMCIQYQPFSLRAKTQGLEDTDVSSGTESVDAANFSFPHQVPEAWINMMNLDKEEFRSSEAEIKRLMLAANGLDNGTSGVAASSAPAHRFRDSKPYMAFFITALSIAYLLL